MFEDLNDLHKSCDYHSFQGARSLMSFSAVRLYVVRVLVMHSLPVSWIFCKRWCGGGGGGWLESTEHSLEEHWVIVEKVMIYKDNCHRSLLWFKLARDSQLFLDTICSISPAALTWFLMNWTREARLVILVFRLCSHEDSTLIIETKSFHLSATCRWPFILMGISSTRFSTQLLVYDLPGERLILNNLQHVVFAK